MSSDIGPCRGGGSLTGSFFTKPFSSDPWDPWDYGGGSGSGNDDVATLAHANVDWRETGSAHIFRVDLPGVRKEELKVKVEDGNVLHMSGNRSVEEEEEVDENHKWHKVERRRGSFSRRFRLPENANVEEMKCGLDDGVLTVELPKKKEVPDQPKSVRYIDVA